MNTQAGEARWNLPPMTEEEVLALPLIVDFVDAARALGLQRSMAYDMARRGTFPIRLLPYGRTRRARRSDLLDCLGLASGARSVGGDAA